MDGRLTVFRRFLGEFHSRFDTTSTEVVVYYAMGTKERLSRCAKLLDDIDRHRERRRDPGLGMSIERRILDREFRELEADIFADPGALAPILIAAVRRRR